MGIRAVILMALSLTALVGVTSAAADGEVGLVVEENGQVRTFCVPYSGDSISGDELLSAAGLPYEDLGTGAGAVLCAIGEVGCFNASSFNSCWCECQSGGNDCVYWGFFTRDYGSGWVYSSRAFDRVEADDGDVHAWKWGQGSPNSAPRPSDSLTFESICGHAPRGGVAPPEPTQPQPTAPPAQGTQPPGSPTVDVSPTTGTETPFTSVPETTTASPDVSVTLTTEPTRAATASSQPVEEGESDGDSGGAGALIGFGAIAAVLLAAIGGAVVWRRTHGG